MIRITAEDIVSFRHCSKGASQGYRTILPSFSQEEVLVLREFPGSVNAREIVKQNVTDLSSTQDWYMSTDFYIYQTLRADLPARVRSGQKRIGPLGTRLQCEYEIGSEKLQLVATIPYLHKLHNGYEAVYLSLQSIRPTIKEWSDVVMRASWNQALFRYLYGEILYSRYLGMPGHIERRIQTQDTDLDYVIENHLSNTWSPVLTPGRHCEDKMKGEFLCPLRRKKQCNPICGIPRDPYVNSGS